MRIRSRPPLITRMPRAGAKIRGGSGTAPGWSPAPSWRPTRRHPRPAGPGCPARAHRRSAAGRAGRPARFRRPPSATSTDFRVAAPEAPRSSAASRALRYPTWPSATITPTNAIIAATTPTTAPIRPECHVPYWSAPGSGDARISARRAGPGPAATGSCPSSRPSTPRSSEAGEHGHLPVVDDARAAGGHARPTDPLRETSLRRLTRRRISASRWSISTRNEEISSSDGISAAAPSVVVMAVTFSPMAEPPGRDAETPRVQEPVPAGQRTPRPWRRQGMGAPDTAPARRRQALRYRSPPAG